MADAPATARRGSAQLAVPAQSARPFEILSRPQSRNSNRSRGPTPAAPHQNGYQPISPDNPTLVNAPRDSRTQLFVGNLPFRVRWQDLKDLFRKAGTVLRSDVALTMDNTRSKGFGTVLFANQDDALRAIELYNGYNWQSRILDVRLDAQDPTGIVSMANVSAQQQQHAAYLATTANAVYSHVPQHYMAPHLAPHQYPPPQASNSRPGSSAGLPPPPSDASTSSVSPTPSVTRLPGQPNISPTSRRAGAPSSLGPMPPSMFAGIPNSTVIPPPPAAAQAAQAAGLSTDSVISPPGDSSQSVTSESSDTDSRSSSQVPQTQYWDPARAAMQSQHRYYGYPPQHAIPGGLVNFHANAGSRAMTPGTANRHLFVGNLPFNCQWQDLKDLFRGAGQILRADVAIGPDGRSRGFGTVLYQTAEDAQNAVRMYNGFDYNGRVLKVHFDKYAHSMQTQGYPPYHNPSPQYYANNPYISQHGSDTGSESISDSASDSTVDEQTLNTNRPELSQLTFQHHPYPYAYPSPGIMQPLTPGFAVPQTPGFASPGHFFEPVRHHEPTPVGPDGNPLAPIGSEHPHHQNSNLPPLSIPPASMFGMNSPLSPQQGRPLMTPSMPGFSFHPFPQTPPLMPQFLSPGLAPYSPSLNGGQHMFGFGMPQDLQSPHPGFNPLFSPHINGPSSLSRMSFPTTPIYEGDETENGVQLATHEPHEDHDQKLTPTMASSGEMERQETARQREPTNDSLATNSSNGSAQPGTPQTTGSDDISHMMGAMKMVDGVTKSAWGKPAARTASAPSETPKEA